MRQAQTIAPSIRINGEGVGQVAHTFESWYAAGWFGLAERSGAVALACADGVGVGWGCNIDYSFRIIRAWRVSVVLLAGRTVGCDLYSIPQSRYL
jgi:hypothetical protein